MIKIQKTNPTARMLKDYVLADQVNFDLPMQRGYVWARDKKSKLILSILEGYPIPPLYANFVNRVYNIIDGQQRGKTISWFLLNRFALGSLPPVVIDGKTYEISGSKFEDLPEELQTVIEQFNLDLQYGENLSEEEQKEMFIRLNSGKPLTATELTKAQIKSIREVTELSKHSVFKKIMNEKGVQSSRSASLIMQAYVAIFEPYKCMLSSAIKKCLVDTQITQDEQQQIKECLDIFDVVYSKICEEKSDIAKKLSLIFKRKSHFIAFIYLIDRSIKLGNSDIDTLVNWAKHFFGSEVDQTTVCEEYNIRLKDSMNSDESVRARLDAVHNDFRIFLKNTNDEKNNGR